VIARARERRLDECEFEKYEASRKTTTFTHVTRNSRRSHRRLWRRGRRTLMGHPGGRTACRSLWSPEITQTPCTRWAFLLAIDYLEWLTLSSAIATWHMINVLFHLEYHIQLFISI